MMREDKSKGKISSLRSPTRPPRSSHPVAQLFSALTSQHTRTFSSLHEQCASLEDTISHVEEQLETIALRVAQKQSRQDHQVLSALRVKQHEFMISELRNSNSKLAQQQQSLNQQLIQEQQVNQQLRQEQLRQQSEINRLEGQLYQKQQQIKELRHQIDSKDRQTPRQRFETPQTLKARPSAEEYSQLQAQLEELEREMSAEVERLGQKNTELTKQISSVQQQHNQQMAQTRRHQANCQELSKQKYEIEVKLKQETTLNQQLEASYNTLVQQSNVNEITLHKQLQEHKNKEAQLRQQLKGEKKILKTCLSGIANHVHGSKYYLNATAGPDAVEEIIKLYEKSTRRKVEQVSRELEYSNGQCQQLKSRYEELQKGVEEAERIRGSVRSVSQVRSDRESEVDRASQPGSSINRSTNRSEEEKPSAQEKFKSKVEGLRKELRSKQGKIDELERQQQSDFDRHKQKILECQQVISEKVNEVRKWQLKVKEKDYELLQASARLKQCEGKLQFQIERTASEKEANSKIIEMRTNSYQDKLKQMRQNYKEIERRQQQKTIKYNKLKSKYEKYDVQVNEALKRKNTQIEQLLKDNNRLSTEVKLLQEKISIGEIIETELGRRSSNTPNTTPVNQDLIEQMEMERDRIIGQLQDKQRQCDELTGLNHTLSQQVSSLKKEVRDTKVSLDEMERMERILKEEVKQTRQMMAQLKQDNSQAAQQQYTYLKKELEKSVTNVKKLQRACEKYTHEREGLKKDIESKEKQVAGAKYQVDVLKGKLEDSAKELADAKERYKKEVVEYERKISEHVTKEEQLVSIINYKNRESDGLRQSMKGEELFMEPETVIKLNAETMTEMVELTEQQTMTDPVEPPNAISPQKKSLEPIIPSQLVLDEEIQLDPSVHEQPAEQPRESGRPVPVNLFGDLVGQEEVMDDHFQICDEEEQINIGQAALNLQLKQLFNAIRKEIQKILNGEELSISVLKELPKSLEDDFTELVSYVKEKMGDLRGENNLTFIMAEQGSEPEVEDLDPQLLAFINHHSHEAVKLRRIIEEKESMITSLMTEKTQQQNTITEQQQLTEQAERLHMQQYNVLKTEIVHQKQNIDKQTLYYESLKNVFKKMINFWIDDEDNYDDFRDNLMLFGSIYQFSKKEQGLLKLYLDKYKELKKIE